MLLLSDHVLTRVVPKARADCARDRLPITIWVSTLVLTTEN